MMKRRSIAFCLGVLLFLLVTPLFVQGALSGEKVDLSDAVIVRNSKQTRVVNAAKLLQYEIKRRTEIEIDVSTTRSSTLTPAIYVGTVEGFPVPYSLPAGVSIPDKAEGYALWADASKRHAPTVYVVGRDDKG
ncbi:MAG: hypothetical protein ACYSWP_13275 [Planctomycetota bacterium]|jgi:hypothetical protein